MSTKILENEEQPKVYHYDTTRKSPGSGKIKETTHHFYCRDRTLAETNTIKTDSESSVYLTIYSRLGLVPENDSCRIHTIYILNLEEAELLAEMLTKAVDYLKNEQKMPKEMTIVK